jgi:hypothetical protein
MSKFIAETSKNNKNAVMRSTILLPTFNLLFVSSNGFLTDAASISFLIHFKASTFLYLPLASILVPVGWSWIG